MFAPPPGATFTHITVNLLRHFSLLKHPQSEHACVELHILDGVHLLEIVVDQVVVGRQEDDVRRHYRIYQETQGVQVALVVDLQDHRECAIIECFFRADLGGV